MLSEAVEVIDNKIENRSRTFHVLSDSHSDIATAELRLKDKIKKKINTRYLTIENNQISLKDLKVAGSIQWEENMKNSNFEHYFEIDGKKITIETFIEMLKCFAGWNFKLEVIDTCDNIDF